MECFTADFLEFSSTNDKIGFWLLLVGWLGIHRPFQCCAGACGLYPGSRARRGLQWHFACDFGFGGFAVLRRLLIVLVVTMGSF